MAAVVAQQGVLRIATPGAVTAAMDQAAKERVANQTAITPELETGLAGFIRKEFDAFRMHRDQARNGWSGRLLSAMRAFSGEYEPTQLQEIRQFGGSEVYARLIAMKCRGASSLLRDVYLGSDRPWGLAAGPDPEVPDHIVQAIRQLVTTEMATLQQAAQQIDPTQVRDRITSLMEAARDAAKKKARDQAGIAEDKIDEILQEGGFYKAFAEFLVDLPLFPFACMKGPVVRIVPQIVWQDGQATTISKPKLFWNRVSPFDIWWTPGASDIEDAAVIERTRLSRADLNDLLDLPGYNEQALRAVLDEHGSGGLTEAWDQTDAERAAMESRENPVYNRSGLITCLEYHGSVQGRLLLENGMGKKQIPDELRDYMVQAWLIGRHVIKVQLSPSPRKRHPYYITSFEKMPGTPVGNGLPDILSDIQDVMNATLRSLVNNVSIASGPQVVVRDDRLAQDEDGDEMYPWKRWHMTADPMNGSSGSEKPVDFFQPNSNAQELLAVYQQFLQMADDISAIPRYMNGSGPGGGAGRTASGLAMLMGNASKILQTVAANVDRDVLEPALQQLFDLVMLTDTSGLLTGQEVVRVMGVTVAVQRETLRSRQLEFLQITANPIDSQIMGPKGRAAVLRAVSGTIGLDGEQVVPSDDQIEQQMQAAQQAQMAQAGAQAQGGQQPPSSNQDTGPRTNSMSVQGGVG